MRKIVSQAFFTLLVFTLTSGVALATTYTIPAGSGTLTYTATPTTIMCMFVLGAHTYSGQYYDTTYSSFSFTVSGVTTPLNGVDHSVDSPDGIEPGSCPKSSFPPVTLTGGGVADVVFTPSGETGGSAS